MNPLVYLAGFLAILVYIGSCYCTYSWVKETHWIWPIGCLIGTATGALWFWIVRMMPNKESIFIASVVWDTFITTLFVLMPWLVFGVKLEWKTWVGLLICVVGLLIIKGTFKG